VLDDLAALGSGRWAGVNYADLLSDPAAVATRLCDFIGIESDTALRERTAGPLPLSRYTQTPPARDKWRLNEPLIERVLPSVEATWRRLQALGRQA
jgi:hypothetical protein